MLNNLALPAVRIDASGALLNTNSAWSVDYTDVLQHLQQSLHPFDLFQLKTVIAEGKQDQCVVRRFARGRWTLNNAIIIDRQAHSTSVIFSSLPSSDKTVSDNSELLGNIVHSSNNYLSAMMGFCELAMLDVKPEHMAYGQLQTVLESGQQAVSFTRDLLACAGRSALRPQAVEWRSFLLAQLQKQAIVLSENVPEQTAYFDPAFISRAINDVLIFLKEQGGTVNAESGMVDISSSPANSLALNPGRYLWLLLNESQCQIKPQHGPLLFQPYYSSKTLTAKKGLGLGPAGGLIWQSHGAIWAIPDAQSGVTMVIVLPVENSATFARAPERESLRAPPTPVIVPLVCDDPVAPAVAQQFLHTKNLTITPISVDEARQMDWNKTDYPLYISTRIENSYWHDLDIKQLIWTPAAEKMVSGSVKQIGVKFSLDPAPLIKAVETLTK